jgi:alpha-tubulin suppressor-like RCC1 family protein
MRWVWLLVACSGCVLREDDLDGDGWSVVDVPADCDDFDAARSPTAEEVALDGVDQDCNGHDLVMRASGETHSCELEADGVVLCDGDNTFGQLDVPVGAVYVQIACGDFHSCALDRYGQVTCWGDDSYGQSSPPPGEFVEIDASANWSLGVHREGTLACWGECRFASAARRR